MRRIGLLLFFISFSLQARVELNKKWIEYSSSEKESVLHLLEILSMSSTGKRLIQEARAKALSMDEALIDVIHAADTSITDSTLIRKFDPMNPSEIIYESKSSVTVNKHHNTYDALLDLAHELSHFVNRTPFNPYRKNFDLKSFVRNTIEGKGGEVEAFITECRVLSELFPTQVRNRYNCRKIVDPETGKISRKLAVERFYQVGEYHDQVKRLFFRHQIEEDFPHISKNKASFISSAYGVPYPLAALFEYTTVFEKACENDERRIAIMNQQNGRSPASEAVLKSLIRGYKERCR
jgi:hypothetical protein